MVPTMISLAITPVMSEEALPTAETGEKRVGEDYIDAGAPRRT